MKTARKITRFYIINPVGDRRVEVRFDTREDVVLKILDTTKVGPGVAREIGQHGLRIESSMELEQGMDLEIAFPKAANHINCFGRVAWVKFSSVTGLWSAGVSLDSWHGIVDGSKSWMTFQAKATPNDRRKTPR